MEIYYIAPREEKDMSKQLKKKLIKTLLHHKTKTYIIIGVSAFVLGYIGGYLAGKHKMKRKIRREKLITGIKSHLQSESDKAEQDENTIYGIQHEALE